MNRRCSSLGKLKKCILTALIVSLVLCGNISQILAEISVPRPTEYKYVNDYARIVDQNSAAQIIDLGRELEQKTGAQAIVVTVNTTNDIPIEDYANTLFRKWGIGRANKDNGLLVLLSLRDKKWRVEVGRGLEGAIPDALSNRIMQELGSFAFSKGYYGQGLAQVYSQFCDEIAT